MDFLHDRYSQIALAVILVIAVVCITDAGEVEQDGSVAGVVYDVKVTDSGNTFTLVDSNGGTMRCFSSETVKEGDVCTVSGKYSQDGTIFFIARISFI